MEEELLKKYGSERPGEIENLNGTTETVNFKFSTAVRFYHNMEDADFPLHWHVPGEIISPIEGTYTVTIAGQTVNLQPHDVLIIASGELHSITAPKTGERYIINYSTTLFQQIQDMAALFDTLYPFRLITHEEDPDLSDRLFALLTRMEGEYFSTAVYRESEIIALMLHFFTNIGRYEHRQNAEQVLDYPRQQDHMRRFAELCTYINNHCTERLSVEDLASRAGFSVYHFSRLFKEITGMTCHNYLVARRIIFAKTLLVDDTIPITEIAMRSGFNSIATFNRLFKAQIGYTPTEYRQMGNTKTGCEHPENT
ncbi:helix-turn-helix domain-containing protein [Gemmiger sp.]